ncbi:MAG TPA: hypothetical protein VFZ65_04470, partial [Planctomycetota bacterium]|nr:hypothetical protein [Planctomycetota bacterium]
MHRQALVGLLTVGFAWSQQPTEVERVLAVLQTGDPVRDGKGAAELLGPGTGLDDTILALARSPRTERVVRLRALRIARLLGLAQRVERGQHHRDVAWWLALDELAHELPDAMRPLLLARCGMDRQALDAARQELSAASELADRFTHDWNETRMLDDAHKEENARYDALEAAMRKAGLAAVPRLLSTLVVPPDIAFSGNESAHEVTARQQVRSMLALGEMLRAKDALPFFVMHGGGPSLTQSADAGMAIQNVTGERFGADFMVEGDDESIMAWWVKHMHEHPIVLDYLVQHLVNLAERDYRTAGA